MMHLRCTETIECDDESCDLEEPKIEDVIEIPKGDLPLNFHHITCGYIFLARVNCEKDLSQKINSWIYPKCDQGKKCCLTDGEGIFSTECLNK